MSEQKTETVEKPPWRQRQDKVWEIIREHNIRLWDILEEDRAMSPNHASNLPWFASVCLQHAIKNEAERMEFDIGDCGVEAKKVYEKAQERLNLIMEALKAVGKVVDYDVQQDEQK